LKKKELTLKRKPNTDKKTAAAIVSVEKPRPFALAAVLLLVAVLVFQAFHMVRMKVRQHIRVLPQAPILAQGDTPGKVTGVIDIKAGPEGTLLTLSKQPKGYFLQRFNAGLAFESGTLFDPQKKPLFKDLVALLVLNDARVLVAERNGRLIRLSKDFKVEAEFKLDLIEIRSMGLSQEGQLWVLEPLAAKILVFSLEGRLLSEFGGPKTLESPRALVVTASGRAVVLDQAKDAYFLKIFSPSGKFERALRVENVSPSPPDTLAAGPAELVALNDAAGARGVLFFDVARGRFYGETLGAAGSDEPMVHPGFVSGDPKTGNFYLHFGPGLLKCRIPEF
jgi:hypothetical protein